MNRFHPYQLFLLFILSINMVSAQTYTLNWGSSFSPAWSAGNTSGTAPNIGGSSVKATVSIVNSQSDAFSNFSNQWGLFTSPRISSGGYPFTTQLGSNAANLALGVDWSSDLNYMNIVITFNSAVKNVKFNVADIDRLDPYSKAYFDEITVTATNGGMPVANPVITKLVSGSNYVVIAGNVARANTTNGRGDNSTSATDDQDGTVTVDFGATILTSVTIRYGNNAASQSNPDPQAIAIGNVSFQRASILPVQLISFNGAISNNQVKLNWSTSMEQNLDKFIVEKSADAVNWQAITTVKAAGNSSQQYNAIDAVVLPVNYYRLKQVDVDERFTWSTIICIKDHENNKSGIRLYPNPATAYTTVSVNSDRKKAVAVQLYNLQGTLLQTWPVQLVTGSNNIPISFAGMMTKGIYMLKVKDNDGNILGTQPFIKQ